MPFKQKMRRRLRSIFLRNRARNRRTKDEDTKEETQAQSSNDDSKKKDMVADMEIIPQPPAEGMMPTYFHVGALAKECLIHGYKIGAWQIMCSSMTSNGYHLNSFGEVYPDTKNLFGGIDIFKDFGNLHISWSWLSTREFLSELGVRGKGLGSEWYGLLRTTLGTKEKVSVHGKFNCGFEHSPVKVEMMVPVYKEPHFMGYIMLEPAKNCLFGYRTVFDMEEKAFDMHALCLGYNNGRTEVGLKLENFKNLRGSIFQRIGDNWAFALKANLYSSENVKQLSIGGQYDFQNGTLLKARIREDSRFGVVYQSKLGDNIDVMYHLGFDLKDPVGGAHKIGASLGFHC